MHSATDVVVSSTTFTIRFRTFLHETNGIFHELLARFGELLNLIHRDSLNEER